MQLIFSNLEEVLNFVQSLQQASSQARQSQAQATQTKEVKTSQTTQTQSVSQKVSQTASNTQKSQASQKPKEVSQNQQTSQKQSQTRPSQTTSSQNSEEKATEKQLRLIFIMLKKLNITDRDIRLSVISKILNKQITSFSKLTKSEATRIIKSLSEKVPAN